MAKRQSVESTVTDIAATEGDSDHCPTMLKGTDDDGDNHAEVHRKPGTRVQV